MPISLPNLDDLTWEQLVDEARLLIPATAPAWTNHNASDPGITVVEVLAHCTEILQYRLNRIGDRNLRGFLTLLRGTEWKPDQDLGAAIRETVADLHEVHRAVSPEDYEAIALGVKSSGGEQVVRVKFLPSRNLTNQSEAGSGAGGSPGHVTLVVLASRRWRPSDALLRKVREALEPARLLTTRIHVVPPQFVTVAVRLAIVPSANVNAENVRQQAIEALERFFDPLEGGLEGAGWPFGRSVFVSEVYRVLAGIRGVDYVTKRRDTESGEELDELLVGDALAGRLHTAAGELEAVSLEAHELVSLWIDRDDLEMLPPERGL